MVSVPTTLLRTKGTVSADLRRQTQGTSAQGLLAIDVLLDDSDVCSEWKRSLPTRASVEDAFPFWWDFFGWYGLYNMVKAIRAKRLLDFWEDRFDQFGATYSTLRAGIRFIATKDPENMKAVLVTKFDDW